jgi:hypothetical protein
MTGCRSCLFSVLEPATEADAWHHGGRFIRTCAFGKRATARPLACASWANKPGEGLPAAAFTRAVAAERQLDSNGVRRWSESQSKYLCSGHD